MLAYVSFELIKAEQKGQHYCVHDVKTIRNLCGLNPKGQVKDLTSGRVTSKAKLCQTN